MCECKNLKYVEWLWDYDGVLYTQCMSCWKKVNKHTNIEFDEIRTKEWQEYWPVYQYSDGILVGYSIYKAEGLTINDDINEDINILWGSRWIDWKEKLSFKPIKLLSLGHLKAILETQSLKDKIKKAIWKQIELLELKLLTDNDAHMLIEA